MRGSIHQGNFINVTEIYFPLRPAPHDELKWYGTPVPIISTRRIWLFSIRKASVT
jgi:hypothetical protein